MKFSQSIDPSVPLVSLDHVTRPLWKRDWCQRFERGVAPGGLWARWAPTERVSLR